MILWCSGAKETDVAQVCWSHVTWDSTYQITRSMSVLATFM